MLCLYNFCCFSITFHLSCHLCDNCVGDPVFINPKKNRNAKKQQKKSSKTKAHLQIQINY